MLATARASVTEDPLTAYTPLAERSPENIRQGNREYVITHAAGQRVLSCALAALLTEDRSYKDAAMRQVETLFDPSAWPEWQDIHHRRVHGLDADLRTGQLCRDLGLAYDWLHPMLSESERSALLEGIDRRGIQPYLRAVEHSAGWLDNMNNWMTCIVGGLGVCGMALAGEHDEAQRLIDLALPRMERYLEQYGPEGEFNENPAYAGSSGAPVVFFSAYRYFREDPEIPPQLALLRKHCIWEMYMTLPPGIIVPFGDCKPDRPASYNTSWFPAVAAATRDSVLQGFYLQHNTPGAFGGQESRDPVTELMFYDATLSPASPDFRTFPLGRFFPAHSGIISSRTDWNPKTAACVVMSKAGHGGVNHTHPDAGQVLIQGYGRRLVRDLGSVDYPSENKRNFYHFSSRGHNLLTFNDRELVWAREHRARVLHAFFDKALGGAWTIDSTELHEEAVFVRRSVMHFLPGIVAVLDEAHFTRPGILRVRWHPETSVAPDKRGAFRIRNHDVTLSGKIVNLDGSEFRTCAGRHRYEPPYDRDRMGNPLPQRREPFFDGLIESDRCRILTLFAVHGPGAAIGDWTKQGNAWYMDQADGPVEVALSHETMQTGHPGTTERLALPLAAAPYGETST